MELGLVVVEKLLGSASGQDQLPEGFRVRATTLQAVTQVEGALLVFVGAIDPLVTHSQDGYATWQRVFG
jgi:hypothetical protein